MKKKIIEQAKTLFQSLTKRITPAFLVTLAMAFIFWYSGKLQHTYTAEISVTVVLDGERHRTTCMVEGTGHNIISARYFKRKTIKLNRSEVELLPVDGMSSTYDLSPTSLQNAISMRYPSLKVKSVSRLPYFILDDK